MIAAEIMKVRTRWLLYVLFLVGVAGAAAQVWLFGYVAWLTERNDSEFEYGISSRLTFSFPYSLSALLDTGQFWGALLVAVLTASMVATDHSWGTVRLALARGQTRNQYLTAKLLGIVAVSVVMMLAVFAIGVVFSLVATAVAGESITFDTRNGPSAAEVPLMVLRAAYAIVPYGMLAFCLTVVGRSTALGATGTLIYIIAESIVAPLLGALGSTGEAFQSLIIGYNASALIAANRSGLLEQNTLAFRESGPGADVPDVWVATLVLAAYSLIFLAISFQVFRTRDVRTTQE